MGGDEISRAGYLGGRRRALQRWSERIDELVCLAQDLPTVGDGLQQDLQGLRDKRDETENRLQQLVLAPAIGWGARLQELKESWSRLVDAWNATFRKLHAMRGQDARGTSA